MGLGPDPDPTLQKNRIRIQDFLGLDPFSRTGSGFFFNIRIRSSDFFIFLSSGTRDTLTQS